MNLRIMDPTQLDAYQPLIRAIFRAMLSTIFIVAGLNHVLSPEQVAARLTSAPMGYLVTWLASPELLVFMAGLALLGGGLAILFGFYTRWAALLLLLLIIPITLTVQVGSINSLGPLFKNVGLAGGLLYFLAHGADALSLDSLRGQP